MIWTSPIPSMDNFKYYVVFVYHFTHYIWLYPLKRKSDVNLIFPHFKTLVENFFKRKIITLYSDNGSECTGLSTFIITQRISHHTFPPHTSEHLVIGVIYGFNLTHCINLLLAPSLMSSLATHLLKVHTYVLILPLPRPITHVMFVLLSQYFLCLVSTLIFLGLMSPLFPHGFLSFSSTQPCLQHPRLRITHPTLCIRSSQPP